MEQKMLTPELAREVEQAIDNELDCYEFLGVTSDAGESEIRTAYKKMSLKLHPDKSSLKQNDDEDVTAYETRKMAPFLNLKNAYDVLSDTDARELYDQRWKDEQSKHNPDISNYKPSSKPSSKSNYKPNYEPFKTQEMIHAEIIEKLKSNAALFDVNFPGAGMKEIIQNLEYNYDQIRKENSNSKVYNFDLALENINNMLLYIIPGEYNKSTDEKMNYPKAEKKLFLMMEIIAKDLIRINSDEKSFAGWFLTSASAAVLTCTIAMYKAPKHSFNAARKLLLELPGEILKPIGGLVIGPVDMVVSALTVLYNAVTNSKLPTGTIVKAYIEAVSNIVHSYNSKVLRPADDLLHKFENTAQIFADRRLALDSVVRLTGTKPEVKARINEDIQTAFEFRENTRDFKNKLRNAKNDIKWSKVAVEKENTTPEPEEHPYQQKKLMSALSLV